MQRPDSWPSHSGWPHARSLAAMNTASKTEVHRWRAFAVLAVAYFMTIVDLTIVNVALPTIGRKLHFSESNLQWVVTAYGLTFGGFLLLGGRAADLLGRRRITMVGLGLFTAASLGAGLATGDGFLIAMRGLQGLGAAFRAPGRALHRDEHVRRGGRTQQGARHLGRHRRPRRHRRTDHRWARHPLRRLAVHLLPQRADRRGRTASDSADRPRKPPGRSTPPLRPARRRHRDRGPARPRLRD